MTIELLRYLRDHNAFEPSLGHGELAERHICFDDLLGGSGCEAALDTALRAGGRVALVGASGAGKSSVVEHVLRPLAEGFAPIAVNVTMDDPEVATEPSLFVRHVVGRLRRALDLTLPGMSMDDLPGSRSEITTRGGLQMGWMGSNVQLARELKRVVEEEAASDNHLDLVRDAMATIGESNLRPLLVLDDTDRWIEAGASDPSDVARRRRAFFGQMPRLIAEELGIAAVIAVHPTYENDPTYQAARDHIATTIHVPRLPDEDAVRRLLEHRVALVLEEAVPGLIDDDAAERIFQHYRDRGDSNVRRRVILIAHTALTRAIDGDRPSLDRAAVEAAISDFPD